MNVSAFVIFKVWFSNRRARLRKHVGNGNPSTALGFPVHTLANMTCQYSPEATQYDWRNAQLAANYNNMLQHQASAYSVSHQGLLKTV